MKFSKLLTMTCVVLVAVNANAQDPLFAPAVNYGAGDGPLSVFSADFDGDNDNDLAVANHAPDNVSILLNNGDGTFAPPVNYAVGALPISVFSADLDKDADYDLAVANVGSNNVSILLNNGDGTFAAAVSYGAGDGPISVFSADLDGDNDNDLAVANWQSDNVSILLNNGDGTFAAAVNYAAGYYPRSVFSADLDGDNDNDLAVANEQSDNVSILLNNGDGTFAAAVNYGAGGRYPISVFSADLDGDNDQDLAVANGNSDNVSIMLNNGDGTFAAAVNYGAGLFPSSVFSVDLDNDNDNDLAVANHYSDNVSILLNNGDGTFAAAVNYAAGDGPSSVFSADLDGDSNYDLAVANSSSDNVSILINLSNVEPYYFVHITDPHVVAVTGQDRWVKVLDAIRDRDPAPEFVMCTGDLVDWGQGAVGALNYEALKSYIHEHDGVHYLDVDYTIPIYFCPGNHDARRFYQVAPPYDFTHYYFYMGPNYYMVTHGNCAIFSLNSGWDIWPCPNFPSCPGGDWDFNPPEGEGLSNIYDNEVTKFVQDLDALDGVPNGTDLSSYLKIVLTHHPYYTGSDNDGVFWYSRSTFFNACNDYSMDLAFCGHIHNWSSLPQPPGCPTQFIITPAIAHKPCYRVITVSPNKSTIEPGPVTSLASTIGAAIACDAELHVYDDQGNHNGPIDADSTEITIPFSYYSHWRYDDDTLGIHTSYGEVSLFKEDTTDYTLVIESLSEDSLNVTLFTSLLSGMESIATYAGIPVDSGSTATLNAPGSDFDYTMYIDDDNDSIPDREIEPDSILYNYICGDVNGDSSNPNVADLTYLVDYLFFEGPPPPVLEAANVDGEVGINVADLTYLVDYLFFEGPAPVCGPIE